MSNMEDKVIPIPFPYLNPGEGCHSPFQGIFLTQGLNLGLLHCWQILYRLNHQRSPISWLEYQNANFYKLLEAGYGLMGRF